MEKEIINILELIKIRNKNIKETLLGSLVTNELDNFISTRESKLQREDIENILDTIVSIVDVTDDLQGIIRVVPCIKILINKALDELLNSSKEYNHEINEIKKLVDEFFVFIKELSISKHKLNEKPDIKYAPIMRFHIDAYEYSIVTGNKPYIYEEYALYFHICLKRVFHSLIKPNSKQDYYRIARFFFKYLPDEIKKNETHPPISTDNDILTSNNISLTSEFENYIVIFINNYEKEALKNFESLDTKTAKNYRYKIEKLLKKGNLEPKEKKTKGRRKRRKLLDYFDSPEEVQLIGANNSKIYTCFPIELEDEEDKKEPLNIFEESYTIDLYLEGQKFISYEYKETKPNYKFEDFMVINRERLPASANNLKLSHYAQIYYVLSQQWKGSSLMTTTKLIIVFIMFLIHFGLQPDKLIDLRIIDSEELLKDFSDGLFLFRKDGQFILAIPSIIERQNIGFKHCCQVSNFIKLPLPKLLNKLLKEILIDEADYVFSYKVNNRISRLSLPEIKDFIKYEINNKFGLKVTLYLISSSFYTLYKHIIGLEPLICMLISSRDVTGRFKVLMHYIHITNEEIVKEYHKCFTEAHNKIVSKVKKILEKGTLNDLLENSLLLEYEDENSLKGLVTFEEGYGSPIIYDKECLKEIIEKIKYAIKNEKDVIERHNYFICLLYILIMISFALRPTNKLSVNWCNLFLEIGIAIINDKNSRRYQEERFLLIPSLLKEILKSYRNGLNEFKLKCLYYNGLLKDVDFKDLLFFIDEKLNYKPFNLNTFREYLKKVGIELQLPLNFLRHMVRDYLYHEAVPHEYANTITGHQKAGRECLNRVGYFSYKDIYEKCTKKIEQLIKLLGFEYIDYCRDVLRIDKKDKDDTDIYNGKETVITKRTRKAKKTNESDTINIPGNIKKNLDKLVSKVPDIYESTFKKVINEVEKLIEEKYKRKLEKKSNRKKDENENIKIIITKKDLQDLVERLIPRKRATYKHIEACEYLNDVLRSLNKEKNFKSPYVKLPKQVRRKLILNLLKEKDLNEFWKYVYLLIKFQEELLTLDPFNLHTLEEKEKSKELFFIFILSAAIFDKIIFKKFDRILQNLNKGNIILDNSIINLIIPLEKTEKDIGQEGTYYCYPLTVLSSIYLFACLEFNKKRLKKNKKVKLFESIIENKCDIRKEFKRWIIEKSKQLGIELKDFSFEKFRLAINVVSMFNIKEQYNNYIPVALTANERMLRIDSYRIKDIDSERKETTKKIKKIDNRDISPFKKMLQRIKKTIRSINNTSSRIEKKHIEKKLDYLIKEILKEEVALSDVEKENAILYIHWCKIMLKSKVSAKTIKDYASNIYYFLEKVGEKKTIKEFTTGDLVKDVSEVMQEQESPQLYKGVNSIIKIFNKDIDNYWTRKLPKLDYSIPKPLIFPSQVELAIKKCEEFFVNCESNKGLEERKYKAEIIKYIIILACYAGMRISEIINLKIEDVDYVDGYILKITKSKTKAGIRYIPLKYLLPKEHFESFIEYTKNRVNQQKGSNEYLFPKYGKRSMLDSSYISSEVVRLFNSIGVKDFRFHHLRHSFVCWTYMVFLYLIYPNMFKKLAEKFKDVIFFQKEYMENFKKIFPKNSIENKDFDAYLTLTQIIGHSGPEITLMYYNHIINIIVNAIDNLDNYKVKFGYKEAMNITNFKTYDSIRKIFGHLHNGKEMTLGEIYRILLKKCDDIIKYLS